MTDLHEQLIGLVSDERRSRMQREAEAYRLLVDRANLRFGPSYATRARRSVARLLASLAQRLEPSIGARS